MMTDANDTSLKITMLKKQACFSLLTDKETDALASLLAERHFAAGETIVKEGDPVDSVYLILSGKAEVRRIRIENNAPRTESLATLGPADAIGLNETGFYSISGVRTATVVALTDVVTFSLGVAAFHGFALAYPHVNEVMRKNAEQFLKVKS